MTFWGIFSSQKDKISSLFAYFFIISSSFLICQYLIFVEIPVTLNPWGLNLASVAKQISGSSLKLGVDQ
ncbi:hypothetical protein KWI06_24030, partial [Enterobacter cloacae]|uniref:hypothetical protein n=1 Tax=Enterobacter cloacae TaxID=550 RepID=UPI0021D332C3